MIRGARGCVWLGLGSREQSPVNIGVASNLETPGVHAQGVESDGLPLLIARGSNVTSANTRRIRGRIHR